MGYKREFHGHSVRLGRPVMEKIAARRPDKIVTECLSCRLQFRHLADYPVAHPLEVMAALLDESRGGRGVEMPRGYPSGITGKGSS